MPSQNSHEADQPTVQNQNNAMSEDPRDGQRLTDKPEAIEKTPLDKPTQGDAQEQPTPEEFGERGMGVAAKE
jgi:hypothetical protein